MSATNSPATPESRDGDSAALSPVAVLRHRAELLRQLRRFFDSRDFLEVQPPCLLGDCVVDAYLDPVEVDPATLRLPPDQVPERLYLQTSPESAMKQALAAGAPSIYSIGPVFRGGESGPWHRVEFTMLEWYEVGGDVNSGIDLLGQLAQTVLESDGCLVQDYRGAFLKHAGIDPLEADLGQLRERVAAVDSSLADSLADDRDGLLDVLLSERVQPQLGRGRPLILKNYPLSQAALARRSPEDPRCAARFELFVDGCELANGYDELRDPDELIRRGCEHNFRRIARGRDPLPVENTLVQAMRQGLPACAGVALGVDRLQMVRHGYGSLPGEPFPDVSASG